MSNVDKRLALGGDGAPSNRPLSLMQRKAARFRAIGYTALMTANELNIGHRTVQRWDGQQDFEDCVVGFRDALRHELGPAIMANVHLAADLQRRVFIGEIPAYEKRWLEAKELLTYVLRWLAPVPDVGYTDPERLPAVEIHLNGHRE